MKGDTFEEESLNNNGSGVDDKKSVGDHLSLTAIKGYGSTTFIKCI
jgi:hypothetical protein